MPAEELLARLGNYFINIDQRFFHLTCVLVRLFTNANKSSVVAEHLIGDANLYTIYITLPSFDVVVRGDFKKIFGYFTLHLLEVPLPEV